MAHEFAMSGMTAVLAAGDGPGSMGVDLLWILASAAVVTMVLNRLKVSAIPGYLVTGMVVGPYALGLVSSPESIAGISGLALVLLMFGIGLHLDISGMRGGLISIVLVGVGTTLANAVCIALPLLVIGLDPAMAAVVGMALCMSSTAVVMKILAARRELQKVHGRVIFGTLLIQDLVVIGFLALIPVLADSGGDEARTTMELVGSFALKTAGAAGLILAGKLVLPRVIAEAARGGGEVLLVVSAAAALAAGTATAALGFSAELGAFLAGFMLASTPMRHQLSGQMAPLRDLFMAVFFTTVGMSVDPAILPDMWWAIGMGVLVTLAVKATVIGGVCWLAGLRAPVAGLVGLGLAQAGEFSLVLIQVGERNGIFPPDSRVDDATISVVIVTLIVTPALIKVGETLGTTSLGRFGAPKWIGRKLLAPMDDDVATGAACPTTGGHALVVGYGPVGRAVSDRLDLNGVPLVILELNPRTVQKQRALGRTVLFGDATNEEVLMSAAVDKASAVVITIPDDDAAIRASAAVRRLNPTVYLAVRTNVLSRAMRAREAGADHVVVEEIEAADAMAREVVDAVKARAARAAETAASGTKSDSAEAAKADRPE